MPASSGYHYAGLVNECEKWFLGGASVIRDWEQSTLKEKGIKK